MATHLNLKYAEIKNFKDKSRRGFFKIIIIIIMPACFIESAFLKDNSGCLLYLGFIFTVDKNVSVELKIWGSQIGFETPKRLWASKHTQTSNTLIALSMFNLPVSGELRLQVLVFGVEELDEVCRLRDPRAAAEKFIAVFLQELEAQ